MPVRTIADLPRNEPGLVDRYLGTSFDKVEVVADNLDAVEKAAEYAATIADNTATVVADTAKVQELADQVATDAGSISHALDVMGSLYRTFATIALGIAGTNVGDYFMVPGVGAEGEFSTLYLHSADGSAQLINKYPSEATAWNRSNHTGTQDISTINGLEDALDAKANENDFSSLQQVVAKQGDSISNMESDMASKTDLSSQNGATLVGYKRPETDTSTRTVSDKLDDHVSIYDGVNVVDDGQTDCFPGIQKLLKEIPLGSSIIVNKKTKGIFYLSDNPFGPNVASSYTDVNWLFSRDVLFTGPGATGNGSFARLTTNPWLMPVGFYNFNWSDTSPHGNPPGGALSYNTIEVSGDNGPTSPTSFIGKLTAGSATVTSTNTGAISAMYPGSVIASTDDIGFPVPDSSGNGSNTVYVYSKADDNSSFVMGRIVNGDVVPWAWTGNTINAVNFTTTAMKWEVAQYIGMDSGWNASTYNGRCGTNYVLNIEPSYQGWVQGIEIDINNYSTIKNSNSWGIMLTGSGVWDVGKGLVITRSNNTWEKGIDISHTQMGIDINSQFTGIRFANTYRDTQGGTATPDAHIRTYEAPIEPYHAFIFAQQLMSATAMIHLFRADDSNVSDVGRFLSFQNSAGTEELFTVQENGCVSIYGPNTGNGSTTNSGGLTTSGITIQPGSNIQIGQNMLEGVVSETHSFIIYDQSGNAWKINCAPA